MVPGAFRGWVRIVRGGARSRASQLIRGVGRTWTERRPSRRAWRAATLAGLGLAACTHHSDVRPLLSGVPASRYLIEFLAAEKQYPGGERQTSRAGELEIVVKREPGIPLLSDSCHSVWLTSPVGRKRILTMREADPGSGSSFGLAWSRDGQAAFIFGGHSGIDCRGDVSYRDLRIIYTLADGVAWEVPGGRPTSG